MSERKVVRELRREGFKVLTRRQWGSKHLALYQWRRVNRRFVGPADHAFAHITVTHDTGDAKADAQHVENIGMDRFGTAWSYNWGLHSSTKTILVGQHMGAAGAHTLNDKGVPGFHDNLNYWGHAVAFIGVPGDEFGDWERSAVAAIIRAERKHGHMKPEARLYPHSKFAWKDCPCDPYRNSIPRIEELAKEEVVTLTKRERFLARLREARKKLGLRGRGPVTFRVVNLASVSSGPRKVKEILRNALSGDVDLVLAVECSDVRIADHVDTAVWEVVQYGTHAKEEGDRIARSGNALIARRGVVNLRRVTLTLGSPAGEGIRARYLLAARCRFHGRTLRRWGMKVTVGHAPPGRAPVGRERLIKALDSLRGIKGGDLNISASAARRRFSPMKTRSAGVLHLMVPWWVRASKAKRFNIGSDHKALEVVLFPRRRK